MATAANPRFDLFKVHKDEYSARPAPELVKVGNARYLYVSGQGEPGSSDFEACMRALFGMAYTVKAACKARGLDFWIGPPEGLWWLPSGEAFSTDMGEALPPDVCWALLIRVPAYVSEDDVAHAADKLRAKGKLELVDQIELRTFAEGLCVQALHVGPHGEASRTLDAMLAMAENLGLVRYGHHHEIYLGDPRRVAPEKLRTILRQPVRPA